MSEPITDLAEQVRLLGLAKVRRHIFLCAEHAKPKCASAEVSSEAWRYLKRRLRELGLQEGDAVVYRSKVGCFRVCTQGPICVVWPDGIFYRSATPPVLERILIEHLIGGRPVEEFVIARAAGGDAARGDQST